MPDYLLFFLTSENHVVNHLEHSCRDDLGALDKACGLARNHAIEIWENTRRVARVEMGDIALDARDPYSL